jgi:methionine synthase I (cobalamin-dependent)
VKAFIDRLSEPTPLLFDGGFGTQLFERGVELPNSSLANQSHPDTVVALHREYIRAGSDIIQSNSFVASQLHLEMADSIDGDARQLALLAAGHARRAVEEEGREVYVAGSIGPSPGAIEADTGDTVFGIANHKVRTAHEQVAAGLAEGGVDLFCLETMFSAKEAAVAVDVARQYGLPIAVNMTYKYTKDRSTGEIVYRTDWGHSAADLIDALRSGEFSDGVDLLDSVQILGLNCGAEQERAEHTGMPYAVTGLGQLKAEMATRNITDKRTMAYPNAGLPKLDLKTRTTIYPQGSDEMSLRVPDLFAAGAHIIGGCCGTGPEHIRAFRQMME